MKRFAVILLLLIFFHSPQAAGNSEMTLEIIPLSHRLVDDVLPVLRPLLSPGGSITGMNNQLIVKSTPGNIAELKRILERIDHAPRKLMISVRQDSGFAGDSREQSVSGRYRSGDLAVTGRDNARTDDGLVISGKGEEGNVIRYRIRDSENSRDENHTFRIQTVEGSPAFIRTGQSVPVRNRIRQYTPWGVYETETHEYYDAGSGFYVLPRLSGDRVTVLAAPELVRPAPGERPVFDVQLVRTTATGALGEWIRLGDINQASNETNRELLSNSENRDSSTGTVWIRVDEIE